VSGELQRVFAAGPRPSWAPLLAARDCRTWHDLDRALRLAYHHLLQGDWARVCGSFHSELAWRSRLIAGLGVQAALSTLHPRISWNGTVMQIETSTELDVHPGGAGLTLLPSALWTGRPMVTDHPDGSTAIIYPALTPLPLTDEASTDPLAELLGHTRAAVLRLAFRERTTTELARELGTSAATVSGHTKTLRAAGLIVTTRVGKAVLHSVTPLGGRLLESAAGSGPQPRVPHHRGMAPGWSPPSGMTPLGPCDPPEPCHSHTPACGGQRAPTTTEPPFSAQTLARTEAPEAEQIGGSSSPGHRTLVTERDAVAGSPLELGAWRSARSIAGRAS